MKDRIREFLYWHGGSILMVTLLVIVFTVLMTLAARRSL